MESPLQKVPGWDCLTYDPGHLLAAWQFLSFCFDHFHLPTVTGPCPGHCLCSCPSYCLFFRLIVSTWPQGAGTALLPIPHLCKKPLISTLPKGSYSHSSWLPLTPPITIASLPLIHGEVLSALSDYIFQKGFLYQSCWAWKDKALSSPFLSINRAPRHSGIKMGCSWVGMWGP